MGSSLPSIRMGMCPMVGSARPPPEVASSLVAEFPAEVVPPPETEEEFVQIDCETLMAPKPMSTQDYAHFVRKHCLGVF